MRVIFTTILGFVFVAAFVAFFVLSSTLAYVDSPERLLDSSRRHDWRDAIVTLTADHVAREVAADPSLKEMSMVELRAIVSNAITTDWLEESLRAGHSAIRTAIDGARSDAIFDLRGTKAALREVLVSLKTRSESNCDSLLGPKNCADADASKRMMRDFEREALRAIGQVADEVDLLESLQGRDRSNAKKLQEGLGNLETVRMAALGTLVVSLLLILLVNGSSARRMVVVTALLAILSSAVYFLALGFSSNLAREGSGAVIGGESQDEVREFSVMIAQQMLDDAVFGSVAPVLLVGIVGVAALVVMALRRRRA
jgi:hypothetical protein